MHANVKAVNFTTVPFSSIPMQGHGKEWRVPLRGRSSQGPRTTESSPYPLRCGMSMMRVARDEKKSEHFGPFDGLLTTGVLDIGHQF